MAPQVPFKLAAKPGTDLWKKPPTHNATNGTPTSLLFSNPSKQTAAPRTPFSSAPLPSLNKATTTFTLPYTTQFDQAGLYLSITKPSQSPKWIKAGVEFFASQPRLSVVCCDNWADWSVAPIPAAHAQGVVEGKTPVTVELEVDDVTVWIYARVDGGERIPLREIAWVFGDEGGKGWEVEIGALVARPNEEVKGELEATFEKFDVQWK